MRQDPENQNSTAYYYNLLDTIGQEKILTEEQFFWRQRRLCFGKTKQRRKIKMFLVES